MCVSNREKLEAFLLGCLQNTEYRMVYTGHRTCRDITSVCVCAFKVRVLMGTMVTLDMQQQNVRTNTHTHSLTPHTHTHSLTPHTHTHTHSLMHTLTHS